MMNFATIIVLAIVLAAVIAAVVAMRKGGGECHSCGSGCKGGCNCSFTGCPNCKMADKAMERVRSGESDKAMPAMNSKVPDMAMDTTKEGVGR